MATAKPPVIHSTAQEYLEILDITNDLVVLKDGSTALVLKVSAINFGLLSEPEQDAIIYAYAALINSLSFPIEILIKSQPKDVTSYLHYIDDQFQHAQSDVRRQQIALYRNFVANLITEQNVLDKNFYVVLPLSALELGLASAANPLNDIVKSKKPPQIDKHYVIEKSNNILLPRRDHMIAQFGRLGLQARHLNTKDLISLFYIAYNAEAAEGAKMVDTKEYSSALIQAAQAGQPAPTPVASAPAPVVEVIPAYAQAGLPPSIQAPPQEAVLPPEPAPAPAVIPPTAAPPMAAPPELTLSPNPLTPAPSLVPQENFGPPR